MLTCYDSTFANIFDEAGIPMILVGDSAGNAFLGEKNTLPVTVDEMIIIARAVVRGSSKALIVADLPFGSYECNEEQALSTAVRFIKEAQVQAVKIEGGIRVIPQINKLTQVGIPVMGHLGMTPQSVNTIGGFRVQGRGDAGDLILQEAIALEQAGIFALVLELIPSELAQKIANQLEIPVIGIGAGPDVDAQVLVWTDFAGLTPQPPKFARKYLNLRGEINSAIKQWQLDIENKNFPSSAESF